jgi:hypothetical protein
MALGLLLLNGLLLQVLFIVDFVAGGNAVRSPAAAVLSVAVAALGPASLLLTSASTARRQARP